LRFVNWSAQAAEKSQMEPENTPQYLILLKNPKNASTGSA
jgi:hypothetical protein